MVPEQRVLRIARIGPRAGRRTSPRPTRRSRLITMRNKADYAAKETRSISQAVVPDQATANAIAARAKGRRRDRRRCRAGRRERGRDHAQGPDPRGLCRGRRRQGRGGGVRAPVGRGRRPDPDPISAGSSPRSIRSRPRAASRSIRRARKSPPSSPPTSARAAIEDLVDKVQNAIDDGGNFTEAAAAAKLPVTTTPLIVGQRAVARRPGVQAAAELAPALKTGFEIAPNDPPEIVALPKDQGYAMVSPAEVVPAAPAPLASIREQVASDWIDDQGARSAPGPSPTADRGQGRARHSARAGDEGSGRAAAAGAARSPPGGSRSRLRRAPVPPALQDAVHARRRARAA